MLKVVLGPIQSWALAFSLALCCVLCNPSSHVIKRRLSARTDLVDLRAAEAHSARIQRAVTETQHKIKIPRMSQNTRNTRNTTCCKMAETFSVMAERTLLGKCLAERTSHQFCGSRPFGLMCHCVLRPPPASLDSHPLLLQTCPRPGRM